MRKVRGTELAGLWLPVLFWCGVIYGLSSIPYLRITPAWWDYPARKMAHMLEYAVLARLLARAFTGSTYWSWKKIFAGSLIVSVLYACTDEYHQTFVPGRRCHPGDVVFDAAGAWLGLGLIP